MLVMVARSMIHIEPISKISTIRGVICEGSKSFEKKWLYSSFKEFIRSRMSMSFAYFVEGSG